MVRCQAELAAQGIRCDGLPEADQSKLRCHSSAFDTSLANAADGVVPRCLLGVGTGVLRAGDDVARMIRSLPEVIRQTYVCATQTRCGLPPLSPELASRVEQAQRSIRLQLEAIDAAAERQLCQERRAQTSGTGCPLPQVSCRDWDAGLARGGRPAGASDRDGFNKGNFCGAARERAATKSNEIKAAAERLVREQMGLWEKRWQCYQPRHFAEAFCDVGGHAAGLVSVAILTARATSLLARGATEAVVRRELRASMPAGAAPAGVAPVEGEVVAVGGSSVRPGALGPPGPVGRMTDISDPSTMRRVISALHRGGSEALALDGAPIGENMAGGGTYEHGTSVSRASAPVLNSGTAPARSGRIERMHGSEEQIFAMEDRAVANAPAWRGQGYEPVDPHGMLSELGDRNPNLALPDITGRNVRGFVSVPEAGEFFLYEGRVHRVFHTARNGSRSATYAEIDIAGGQRVTVQINEAWSRNSGQSDMWVQH